VAVLLSDLVARVKQNLYGYTSKQQQYAFLTQSIGTTDTSFTVNDATQISRGAVEIGAQGTAASELVLVKTVNRSTGTVTLEPGGRGFAGTTALAWSSNTLLENNPIFPQVRLKEAINDAIRSVYPDLFAVGTSKFAKISVQYNYAMPASSEEALQVKYQIIGPSKIYPWCRRWRFDNNADTTDFPTGKSIEILEEITPGREIQVTYMQEPGELVNLSDDFATVTGLPGTAQDVIVYGAIMKMIPALTGPRMILDTVEASERAASVQNQQIIAAAQFYQNLYAQRMAQEQRKLSDRYPRPIHFDS